MSTAQKLKQRLFNVPDAAAAASNKDEAASGPTSLKIDIPTPAATRPGTPAPAPASLRPTLVPKRQGQVQGQEAMLPPSSANSGNSIVPPVLPVPPPTGPRYYKASPNTGSGSGSDEPVTIESDLRVDPSSTRQTQTETQTYRQRLLHKLGSAKYTSVEEYRLDQDRERSRHWKRWGPYLSERQWATVREDYSSTGDAWTDFPHEHARSRAYRWGEDGIGGISDNHGRLCWSLALWNEEDDILKERLFGVTGHQGNHGEDVKELYYYLDSTVRRFLSVLAFFSRVSFFSGSSRSRFSFFEANTFVHEVFV